MKPEIKAQWVAALRSGEYGQGRRALRNVVGSADLFCCLGVLCDLHRKAGLGQWNGSDYGGEMGILPSIVTDWADIDDDPYIDDEGELTSLNDGNPDEHIDPLSFAQIADLIEVHL